MVIYLLRCMYFYLISERFQAARVRLPACEQVEDHQRRHTYNRRRQSSVEDHARTVSSTHDISSHQTLTTRPSRLSAAVTSAARRRRPHHGSADAERETQQASRWPRDSWHTDGPHEDPYDESGDTTDIDIVHKLKYITQTDILHKHKRYCETET